MRAGTEWIVVEGHRVRLRHSAEFVLVEDRWLPETVEFIGVGDGEPDLYLKVEVSGAGPKLVELRFLADAESRGIRQGDLRDVTVARHTDKLVSIFSFAANRVDPDPPADGGPPQHPGFARGEWVDAQRLVGRLRQGRTSRDITPELLERVAQVYRDNIEGNPTKAVQFRFQVAQRTAAEYVSRARKRGLLPPTKRGKKQA